MPNLQPGTYTVQVDDVVEIGSTVELTLTRVALGHKETKIKMRLHASEDDNVEHCCECGSTEYLIKIDDDFFCGNCY